MIHELFPYAAAVVAGAILLWIDKVLHAKAKRLRMTKVGESPSIPLSDVAAVWICRPDRRSDNPFFRYGVRVEQHRKNGNDEFWWKISSYGGNEYLNKDGGWAYETYLMSPVNEYYCWDDFQEAVDFARKIVAEGKKQYAAT